MHPTLVRLIRVRKKPKISPNLSLQKLVEIEKSQIPVFQKALAAIRTHYALDPNLDDMFWKSMSNFEKMDPCPDPELVPFLSKLISKDLTPQKSKIIGDIAYKSNVLDNLPIDFALKYIRSLTNNSFRAIELAKRYDLPISQLIKLYLRADQFQAAESLAQNVDDGTIVEFIIAFARHKNQKAVKSWISKLSAPSPQHLSKIKHFMLLYNMDFSLPSFDLENERRPKLDTKQIQLVTAINRLVVKHPQVLEGEIYQQWAQLLVGNVEIIPELLDKVAENTTLDTGDLTGILKHLSKPEALALIDKMNYNARYPTPDPSDWCVILSKMKSGDDLSLMIEQIKYTKCLNDQVISALCRFNPSGLIDIVLNLPAPTDYQLLSCWKARPTMDQVSRLEQFDVTPSFAYLRAVLRAFVAHQDFVSIASWIKKYQLDLSLELPLKFQHEIKQTLLGTGVSPTKLGAPAPGTQDWKSTCRTVLPPWVDSGWVIAKVEEGR